MRGLAEWFQACAPEVCAGTKGPAFNGAAHLRCCKTLRQSLLGLGLRVLGSRGLGVFGHLGTLVVGTQA